MVTLVAFAMMTIGVVTAAAAFSILWRVCFQPGRRSRGVEADDPRKEGQKSSDGDNGTGKRRFRGLSARWDMRELAMVVVRTDKKGHKVKRAVS